MLRKELVNPQKSVPPDIYSVAEKFQPATEEGQSKHLLHSCRYSYIKEFLRYIQGI